jgi:hypothetical protein
VQRSTSTEDQQKNGNTVQKPKQKKGTSELIVKIGQKGKTALKE